jgi:hypothetical protein
VQREHAENMRRYEAYCGGAAVGVGAAGVGAAGGAGGSGGAGEAVESNTQGSGTELQSSDAASADGAGGADGAAPRNTAHQLLAKALRPDAPHDPEVDDAIVRSVTACRDSLRQFHDAHRALVEAGWLHPLYTAELVESRYMEIAGGVGGGGGGGAGRAGGAGGDGGSSRAGASSRRKCLFRAFPEEEEVRNSVDSPASSSDGSFEAMLEENSKRHKSFGYNWHK